MENWLQQFVQFLPDGQSYYLVLFLIAFGESLPLIGLLVPGSTLIVLAGFLVFNGKGLFLAIFASVTIGALLGDLLSYWLGKRFGGQMITMRSFRKHHQTIQRSERFFCDHGGKSLFFARFLGPIRGITPFIAGLSKMPPRPLSLYTLISSILWGIAYPGLGYLGGASWQKAQSLTAKFGLFILLALALIIIHHWLRKSLKLPGENSHGN
jgi:undecaprenyl-diphosphatase